MDEAPKEPLWHILPAVMIVLSVLFLLGATRMQVLRQREVMNSQIRLASVLLEEFIYRSLTRPGVENISVHLQQAMGYFRDALDKDVIKAVALLYHESDLEQSLAEYTSGWFPRDKRRIARLEDKAQARVPWHAESNNCGHSMCRHLTGGGGSGGSITDFWIEKNNNYCVETDEEGTFYISWVAECYPMFAAMRQLIPVYVMTALLIAAVVLTKKKYTKK